MNRDEIRAKATQKPKRSSKLIDLGDGTQIEMRAPTMKSRAKIVESSGAKFTAEGDMVKGDAADLQIAAVMGCAYVPGTEELVYEKGDRELLEGMPVNGWFAEAAGVAVQLIAGKDPDASPLDETPSDS